MVASNQILEYFRDKKILVTGHTGFKGAWMLEVLRNSGALLYGISLPPKYDEDLFVENEAAEYLEKNIYQDIRDGEKVKKYIQDIQPDILFHLAAQALVIDSYAEPTYTYEVNVMGTIHILEALKALDKKVTSIFITTDKVYENKEEVYAYQEEDKLGGYDPYSSSKAACEIAISSWERSFFNPKEIEKHKKNIARARAGNVIGGGDLSANRLLPDLYKYVRDGSQLSIRSPEAVRPWQNVIEPVWAYIYMAYLIDSGKNPELDYLNIGPSAEDNLSVRNVVETFLQNIDHSENIQFGEDKSLHEAGLLMLDIRKAEEVMDWTPILNAKQAIQWTADWYMDDSKSSEKCQKQISEYLSLWDQK